ncbi:MAG TPA: TonB-dependent receptor plug domain-containing protein, partial [Chitinophagaceae bacterium]|nr:TonB-dependent receptor plug domain-containing protein [Chitinophagaceae bacterium]
MHHLRKGLVLLLTFTLCYSVICSQPPIYSGGGFSLKVLNEKSEPANGAVVELRRDNKLVKVAIVDSNGVANFEKIDNGDFTFFITNTGYKQHTTAIYHFPSNERTVSITLEVSTITLEGVNVASRKPFIQQQQGKTILNVEASPTSAGSTVLEVLEKSPGVTVDRNGSISLRGKAGVLVLIDSKPTYLSGADLNNLLSSMSSSQVERIELMTNPPAQYDASGNAGIINIITKKNRQKGFNGSFTVSAGQGVYPKNNNSAVLNFRTGKINTFFNYNINLVKYLTDLYALRKYYDGNGSLTGVLDQPAYFSGNFINNT